RYRRADLATIDLEPRAMRLRRRPRAEREAADRGDRRQRLAAESERGDFLEGVERGDLAGRVAGDRQRQFLGRQATAVVADADQADAAFLEVDVDAGGAGVQGILDQ